MKKTADDPKRDRRLPTKLEQLEQFRDYPEGTTLTTDQGVGIPHTDDSLRAGTRGPSLLEDFHLREKITRFDHERIPERVVHARGSAAHGYFQVYQSLEDLTCADFLCDPSIRTPVFVRFSTVVGSRGSADTVRDVRGFATKFYTRQGNFDLVGNNIPVFFIQDGIKFPDVVHAVKPEPHHEMPQASSAHDTFWDFVSLVPETAHMVLWVMSDRGIPRSYRMMEGFGVHTFKLVNAQGQVRLCKIHWKPVLGAHALVWDEAQKVRRVGRLVLDRNPDNFFSETEQVAFCVQNLVPGIDVTNDPLMQARLFSYLDTQLTRLGGPNFAELPINRPVVPVHNHQQDGFHRQRIPTMRANYHPNSIDVGCPFLAGPSAGFVHRPEPVAGEKTRARSESFLDHFSQARMFLASQSPEERAHLVEAMRFEVGKVARPAIRERVLALFLNVDVDFTLEVAAGLGLDGFVREQVAKLGDALPVPRPARAVSPALSLANQPRDSVQSRVVAILADDGADPGDLLAVRTELARAGARTEVIATRVGSLRLADGSLVNIDKSVVIAHSVMYDGVHVAAGAGSATRLATRVEAIDFLRDAFRHCKTIGAAGEGAELLRAAGVPEGAPGVIVAAGPADAGHVGTFLDALRRHRHFERELAAAR